MRRMVLALTAVLVGCSGTPAPRPPNVVVYLIDTLRADRVGAYGYERARTPTLDALAADGVVFDDAWAPAPWTLPSAVSLHTCLLPADHGVLFRGQRIGAETPTLTESLAARGYFTVAQVANPFGGVASGLDRGFSASMASESTFLPGPFERAVDLAAGAPVFAYIHTVEPHRPYDASTDLLASFGGTPDDRARIDRRLNQYKLLLREVRAGVDAVRGAASVQRQQRLLDLVEADIDQLAAAYDADVAWADRGLADLVDVLRQRGMWDDTILVVVSDHGEEFFDHGGALHGRTLYRELTHIPMVWHIPGAKRGRTAVRANLVDVWPTVAELVGATAPTDCAGRSLAAVARDPGRAVDTAAQVIAYRDDKANFQHFELRRRGARNVRIADGDWHGIWNVEPDNFELFNRSTDPTEQSDVSAAHAPTTARLRSIAQAWLTGTTGRRAAATGAIDPDSRKKLEALGYLDE